MKTKKQPAAAAAKIAKVTQLKNKNQFIINTNEYRFFQSYDSLIAVYNKATHNLTLGCDWDYSNTTRKHLYIFINQYCCCATIDAALNNATNKRQAILKMIKSGLISFDPSIQ